MDGVKRAAPEIDFRSANDAGLEGVADPAVLEIAARAGRVLLTHDRRTMPYHFAERLTVGDCPGVVIVPKTAEIRLVIDAIILIWAASEAEEYENRIFSLEHLLSVGS